MAVGTAPASHAWLLWRHARARIGELVCECPRGEDYGLCRTDLLTINTGYISVERYVVCYDVLSVLGVEPNRLGDSVWQQYCRKIPMCCNFEFAAKMCATSVAELERDATLSLWLNDMQLWP